MSNFTKKGIVLLVVLSLLQGVFVTGAAAVSSSAPVVYDFYAPGEGYNYLYHWRTVDDDDYFDASSELSKDTKVAYDKLIAEYNSGVSNWTVERFSGNATVYTKGYIAFNVGAQGTHVLKLKAPGTGNYEVDFNYVTTNKDAANSTAEFMIIPVEQDSYTAEELSTLISQHRAQLYISCYDASKSYKEKTATLSCSLQEGKEYFLVIGGGSKGGGVYLRNLTARRVGEYDPPEPLEYPRPVTILEDAMVRWRDDGSCVAEVNGYDYLALPINGGKMYVYNLDTWQLVDVVTLGTDISRGITVDDNGVIYVVGDSYYIYMYDLKTNGLRQSTKFTGNGVSAGSAYDISCGDDGNLYFGTNKGHIIRYNPIIDESTPIFVSDYGISNATYVSCVIQSGQYIYAAVTTNTSKHYLLKLDKDTFAFAGICDYTGTGMSSYLGRMSVIPGGSPTGGDIIMGNAGSLMAIDTNTMTLMTPEEFGTDVTITGYVSKEIDGKYYFVSAAKRDVYVFDMETKKASKSDYIGVVTQGFAGQGATVTLTRNGVTDEYLYGFTDAKNAIYITNLRTGERQTIRDLIDQDAGASSGINSLTAGPAGSNELYYGGFLSDEIAVYNTQLGVVTDRIKAAGIQSDAICVYDGEIYVGNYTEAHLTRLHRDTNKPEVLMTLHNSLFNQSRIESITAGDNKIFFGTFPYVYKYGGVLAWYDLETNRSYVAVGQNPEDVYYANYEDTKYDYTAKNPVIPINEVKWYNEVTGEQVTAFETWTGIVDYQGIKDVAYHNGILYAATSRTGGTNTSAAAGTSAVIIAYDIAARKVIATFDPATVGFAAPVPAINGIAMDESGTLWCSLSETLFTLSLDADNIFIYNEKVSFDKYGYDGSQGRGNSDIVFKDGYVYASLERIGGLCKVNMENPADYTLLMPETTANSQVPESIAFGEDGNLYFLEDTSLKMLVTDPTEEEWDAARAVTQQISRMTPDLVPQARQAYDALTLRQKSLVQNYEVLLQAEADALMEKIEELGTITWSDYDQVLELLDVYGKMPKTQQSMVKNHYKLINAQQKLQYIEQNWAVVVINGQGETLYYQTLEEAAAATTEGAIYLRDDITAGTVILKPGVTLDLSGYTLTADYLFAMKGATVTDGGADCIGGGLLKIGKGNLALAEDNGNGIIPVWNGTDGYVFTKVTFLQMANTTEPGVGQYIFLPRCSNAEAAAFLADGGLDNGLKIKVNLSWNEGQSQQYYTYGDELVAKVFDGTNRWVFELKITGIGGIEDLVASPVVVTDCGAQATTAGTLIEVFEAQ